MTRKSSAGDLLAARGEAFRGALLSWYRSNRRRLPWRESPSPYGTVVSEFMLQQTQVSTVLPYFARWMGALPDFAALASARETDVLKLWEGLGYYSRARNLHRLAKAVAHPRGLPNTAEELAGLPGVGPYTAAAISSIAFGEPRACVDGNVVRILARLTRDATPYRDSAAASRALAPLAQRLVNPDAPGDHNQAMMELGATICLRQGPRCPLCPVRGFCGAARSGDPGDFPRLAKRTTERRSVVRVWCERAGALLLHRNAPGARRLAGLHELPTAEQAGMDPERVSGGRMIARRSRGITRFRIVESIHLASARRGRPGPGLAWVPTDRLDSIVLSGPHRRWVAEILSSGKAKLPRPHRRPRAA
jgi:A/G-specific adenine glycosylase